jgi:hypothetical protein
MMTDNFCFYLLNRLIQTSQKGGQWFSDYSPFSIPWFELKKSFNVYRQILFKDLRKVGLNFIHLALMKASKMKTRVKPFFYQGSKFNENLTKFHKIS